MGRILYFNVIECLKVAEIEELQMIERICGLCLITFAIFLCMI